MHSQDFDFTYVPGRTDLTDLISVARQSTLASQSCSSTNQAPWPILILMLGSFRVLKAGIPVALPGKKMPAFLAALAIAPDHRMPREALLEVLWPELKHERAIGTLNTLVYKLRDLLSYAAPKGGLEAEAVLYEDGHYRLNVEAGVVVDIQLFEGLINLGVRQEHEGDMDAAIDSYREAARLYRGELSLVIDIDTDDKLRERLRLAYLHALGRLAEHYYTLGDYATCLQAVRRYLIAEPYHEEAHRLMIYCYMRMGQRAQALRQFRRCEQLLRAEFDARPQAATVALYNQVRLDPDNIDFPASLNFSQNSAPAERDL